MKDRSIPNSNIIASSVEDGDIASNGRLCGSSKWGAVGSDTERWIQADIGNLLSTILL